MKLTIGILSLATVFSQSTAADGKAVSYKKVPVDLFVMSKCPDALLCENLFGEVMEKIGSIVDMSLNFIGDSFPEPSCKHGPSECAGNAQAICAKKVAPNNWYQFVLCLNKDLAGIGENQDQLSTCLSENSIPLEPFNKCLENSSALLKTNFNVSETLKINCTIHINKGHYKCVHDGGWYDCPNGHSVSEFINQICSAYPDGNTPDQCKQTELESNSIFDF